MRPKLSALALLFVAIRPAWAVGQPAGRVPDVRMAAYHRTLVAVGERAPTAVLFTYRTDRFSYGQAWGLARFVVGVERGGAVTWATAARDVRVEDLPGGVTAAFTAAGTRVRLEILALPWGRGAAGEEGGVLVSARCTPAAPLRVRVEPGRPLDLLSAASANAWTSEPPAADGAPQPEPPPHQVAWRADGGAFTAGEVRFPGGAGRVLAAFAGSSSRAQGLAATPPASARRRHGAYYAALLSPRIRTPVPVLDRAFRSAIVTLDYNWLHPYGWVECIHHWLSLWHMQHSPAEGWLGHEERARDSILAHARRLLPGGAVPQLSPGGRTHRDFGGSNQFFTWQVRHYLRQTGDLRTARELAPVLDRVLAHTWQENDADGNGLLAWGQQIGNQEDYVSTPHDGTTPTVEGIEMARTRAEVARFVGDPAGAARWEARARTLAASLRSALWQPDIGRYAFYRDPYGVVRPDGQYHTLIHPVIAGLLDPFDAYTSIRQLRDRLTGPGGEVYCSANFPWHAVGTWGMQAGAAQQPWAAWGLAAAGLRNEAYRPLVAAARWAMDPNHRGAWPEVSTEPTPAYFSPPAGLTIQAVVEALFGLTADVPRGTLRVAPCLPDAWPAANLTLPRFAVQYRRSGTTRTYRVTSARRLARRFVWRLPPGRVAAVRLDGRPAPYRVAAGVACINLTVDAPPCRVSTLQVMLRPSRCQVRAAGSAAEGDGLPVHVSRARVLRVADPCGVLASHAGHAYTLRRGLNALRAGGGRLGDLTFQRRTFFLLLQGAEGERFWQPIDFTLRPRFEAAAEPIQVVSGSPRLRVLVRNNTAARLRGPAYITGAFGELPVALDVPPRREVTVSIALTADKAAALSAGDNRARLLLPQGDTLSLALDASDLYRQAPLAAWQAQRMMPIPLPDAALRPDTEWRTWAAFSAYSHWPWANSRAPLEATANTPVLRAEGLEPVPFHLQGRSLAPVSTRSGQPSLTIDTRGTAFRKLYLLVAAFADNHDTFAPIARAAIHGTRGEVVERTLRSPGDLDWWCPEQVVGAFATAARPRTHRLGLLPLLGPTGADSPVGKPPAFPQPEYWATCRVLKTASCVMNVVELDLERPMAVQRVVVSALTTDAAIGVVAATGERATGHAPLAGTPWLPRPDLREPRPLFALSRAGDTEGWTTEGGAFSVASVRGLFETPTLNSLASAGEAATGSALSPPFTIDAAALRFRLHGGTSRGPSGPGALQVRLLDAVTGAVLAAVDPPGTHVAVETVMDVRRWTGRSCRLQLVDLNDGPSYAWLGFSDVSLAAR